MCNFSTTYAAISLKMIYGTYDITKYNYIDVVQGLN